MNTTGARAMETGIKPMLKLALKIKRNKVKLDNKGREELGDERKTKFFQRT